ncbi:MAG: FHA domain-containing protein [Lacipirellulaceae bacterium]
MEVTLKVLAGAKKGAKIVVKKSEFTIGRSQECHLCVGSTSISRKHCMISRGENRVTVKDLGSRNGTLVNGQKTEGEVELKAGDELVVGPLKFQVRISSGLKNEKLPKVKSVAEAVERAANIPTGDSVELDIDSWLLGPDEPVKRPGETLSMQMDETSAIPLPKDKLPSEPTETIALDTADVRDEESPEDSSIDEASDSKKKKEPGKLPPLPKKDATKDSREAAENALRAWSRRR